MQTFLPEIATLLAGATTLPIRIGRPGGKSKGVFIWPWRTSLDQVTFRSGGEPTTVRHTQPSAKIELAILVRKADVAGSLSDLFACGLVLNNTPVLQSGNAEGRIMATTLSHEDLCHLFEASGLRLTPCLTFTLLVPPEA